MHVTTQTVPFHLPEQDNHVKYSAREDMRGHRRPLQAVADVVSGVPLTISMNSYQYQPIGILILFHVPHDISI